VHCHRNTLVYVEQRAAHLHASAREVIEHLRTVYVIDGTPLLSR
jgi:hypothetical protein